MNIIEAIKSGKRFRRKDYDGAWFMARKDVYDIQPLNLDYGSIVADDWEVEPRTVTVNREQLDAAWERAATSLIKQAWTHEDTPSLKDLLMKELGL